QGIKLGQPVWLAAIAAVIIPLYMFAEAKFDRVVMNQAIDYVFTPDFERDQFSGSRLAVRRSLHRLRDIKDGAYMPFLTEFYNAAVFNNLVLNDKKMQILHRAFFGEEIKNLNEENEFGDLFGRRRGRDGSGRTMVMSPRPAEAKLVEVTSTTSPEGSGTRTLVKLEMHNPTSGQTEFATDIQIPPGVFVSGYWLDVEGERVPGQIFERKTAMWVYRMIRDVTRRDPGLLTYTGPNSLQLRVFPFSGNQTRITEIEFLAPAGIAADVRIGDRMVDANAEIRVGSSTTVTPAGDDHQLVSLDREALAALPSVKREPYLHFVVDRSVDSDEPTEILATLELIAQRFPNIEDCKITAANFEFTTVSDGITPISEIGKLRDRDWLKPRGTLLQDLAIQRILAHERSTKPDRDPLRTPVIVVVANDETEAIADHKLVDFATSTPDIDHFYVWRKDNLIARSFDGGKIIQRPGELTPKPVKLLLSSGYVAPILADSVSASVLLPKGEIRALDGKGGVVPAAAGTLSKPSPRLAGAAKTWTLSDQLLWNPSSTTNRLPELVSLSRETGTLVPSTAYIVVENSAQWKMLKRKEKQKLKGNHGLDFMESSEPAVWVVAAIFGIGLIYSKSRRRITA
ncbi:MAG: MSEP-CTERM sorting domain-containing protein, partial [Verrucomicrobiota bacterium]